MCVFMCRFCPEVFRRNTDKIGEPKRCFGRDFPEKVCGDFRGKSICPECLEKGAGKDDGKREKDDEDLDNNNA